MCAGEFGFGGLITARSTGEKMSTGIVYCVSKIPPPETNTRKITDWGRLQLASGLAL